MTPGVPLGVVFYPHLEIHMHQNGCLLSPPDFPEKSSGPRVRVRSADTRKMVDWTDAERDLLARRVWKSIRTGRLSVVQAIEQAQEDFAPARRRRISATAQVPWIFDRIAVLDAEQEELADRAREAAGKRIPLRDLLPGLTLQELLVGVIRKTDQDNTARYDDLVRRLNRIESQVRLLTSAHPAHAPASDQFIGGAARNKYPLVWVVGFMSDQLQHLQNRCKGLPVVIDGPDKNRTDPHFKKDADYVLLITKFLSHNWSDSAFAHFEALGKAVVAEKHLTGKDAEKVVKHYRNRVLRCEGSIDMAHKTIVDISTRQRVQ